MLMRDAEVSLGASFLPQYLQLNTAIEQLTADMAANDPGVFRGGGGDIRYVAERQLFFALFANRELFDYFVACRTGALLPDDASLSTWVRSVAPYFRGERRAFDAPDLRTRLLRLFYRRQGQPSIRIE